MITVNVSDKWIQYFRITVESPDYGSFSPVDSVPTLQGSQEFHNPDYRSHTETLHTLTHGTL